MRNECIRIGLSKWAEVAFPDSIDEPRLPVYDSLQAKDTKIQNLLIEKEAAALTRHSLRYAFEASKARGLIVQ